MYSSTLAIVLAMSTYFSLKRYNFFYYILVGGANPEPRSARLFLQLSQKREKSTLLAVPLKRTLFYMYKCA